MRETPHFGLDMKVICKHSASQWSFAIQATDEFYSAGRARFRFQYGKLVWKPSKPIRVYLMWKLKTSMAPSSMKRDLTLKGISAVSRRVRIDMLEKIPDYFCLLPVLLNKYWKKVFISLCNPLKRNSFTYARFILLAPSGLESGGKSLMKFRLHVTGFGTSY